MFGLNSNLFHNIANAATIGLAMLTAGLLATGCVTTALGVMDCSASFIDPTWSAVAIAVVGALKFGVNIVRDGFGGLAAPQPPVVKPTKPFH